MISSNKESPEDTIDYCEISVFDILLKMKTLTSKHNTEPEKKKGDQKLKPLLPSHNV